MKNKRIFIFILVLVLTFLISFLSNSSINKVDAASGGNVSITADFESYTNPLISSGKTYYGSLSQGNMAIVNIIIDDPTGRNVTIYYHTVSGSALPGTDYTEISDGVVVSKHNGYDKRVVRIGITTNTTDIVIKGFKDYEYLSKSFSVVIDKAVYDDGEELTKNTSSYIYDNKTFNSKDSVDVYLKANTDIMAVEATSGYVFQAYNKTLSYDKWFNNISYDKTCSDSGIFKSGNSEMDKIKKLGLGDYYVYGECYLSEEQDSDEETTRFIVGNEKWSYYGGASCSTRGTGWFFGVEIDAYNQYVDANAIYYLVDGLINNNQSSKYKASDYFASGLIDQYDYVIDGNSRNVFFRNSASPGCGYSVYRHYACDGKINIHVIIREKVFDTTAPIAQNIYLDTTSQFSVNGKYRLAVKFNEPVQNAVGTKIVGETNSSKQLIFTYAGGEGTDTLYYDCDTTDPDLQGLSVKKVIFNNVITNKEINTGFYLFDQITDFAGNKPEFISSNCATSFDISLDYRIPQIEVDQINQSSSKPKKNPSVSITLNKFTSGTLYYEWISESSSKYTKTSTKVDSTRSNLNKLISNNSTNKLAGYQVISNTSQDSSIKTQVNFESNTESGTYYLVCFASPTFNVSDENIKIETFGPYIIDNTAPTFSSLHQVTNKITSGGFNRTFTFDCFDEYGIESVTALIKESKQNAKVYRQSLSISDSGHVSYTLDLDNLISKYYTNDDGVPLVNTETGFYDIDFEIKDNAGNITYVYGGNFENCYLSVSPYFEANVEFYPDVVTEILGDNLYLVGTTLKAYATNAEIQGESIRVSINGSEYTNYLSTENYTLLSGLDHGVNVVYITFINPGYYSMKFEVTGSYSDTFNVYVTNNYREETANYLNAYSDELLLINKVVQLNENIQFVYINSDRQIEREYYGGAVSPTFSSDQAALSFLKAYEYLDLKYEVLSDNTASYLNTGSGEGYNKASGESIKASKGQVWIRYKRTSWDVNSESINDWAYYFYSYTDDGTNTINIDNLSVNLLSAIDTVAKKILSKTGKNPNAQDIYLVDDEHLDPVTKAPTLKEAQIALSRAVIYNNSKCGSVLLNASYTGDPNLFNNTIRVNISGYDYDLPIATNMKLHVSSATKLFYSLNGDVLNFVELKPTDGMSLRDAINATGVICTTGTYVIKEYDESGCSLFYVYIDADAPKLGHILNNNADVEYIDSLDVANLFASNLVLKSIGYDDGILTETDKNAFVALFTLPGQKLYSIYFRGEIPDEKIEEGTYLVVVGDRSGNVYSYKTYISSATPKVTFKSYDTKFTITIDNRTADELQSVEVYCNEVLVSTKLLTSQTFTSNGDYRIVIVDKYSIEEWEFSEEYKRSEPSIDFYYDIDNDGFFTKYIESNSDYMIIENEADFRLVSTSRRLKIQINSDECDFSINGILPSDYTYNEANHTIEIKKLASFYLDIWNKVQTEDIISYKIIVDNYAPLISVTTDTRKVIFDETNEANYNASMISDPNTTSFITPNSIKYSYSNETISFSVNQDDIISNEYVSVKVTDDTLVKEVRVYQKNELVKTFTKDDLINGEISFHIGNKEGEVKIVAVDIFNTSTSFIFNFAKKKLSSAVVDDVDVNPSLDKIIYGNTYAVIEAYKDSQVHIMYELDGIIYSEVYKYENNKLYIGRYKIGKSKADSTDTYIYSYGVVDFYNGGILVDGEYVDKPLELDLSNTYKINEDLELYLICNPDKSTLSIKFVGSDIASKVNIRIDKDNTIAEYYEIELSKELGELNFSSSTGEVEVKNDYIYTNTFDVDVTFDPSKITDILVCYNPISNDFSDLEYVYFDSSIFNDHEGYYLFIVTNIYNNVRMYNLIYSKAINAFIEISYSEKENETYSIIYSDTFYTNSKATIKGYNLKTLTGMVDSDSSIISSIINGEEVILNIDKTSTVTIEDIYGNKKTIKVIVNSINDFKYNESWLTGFSSLSNSDAGFSKDLLTINLNPQSLKEYGINQIKVKYESNLLTIYGYDGLEFIDYNSDNFINCIGNLGNGDYEVIFSNIYGDITTKLIHYSDVSSLVITRQTSSSIKEEVIKISDALDKGVWSNREIRLTSTLSDSAYYKFYIKNDSDSTFKELVLPYELQLASTSQNGTINYTVKYVDAYGYSFEFVCHLNKQDLIVNAVDMDFVTISQIEYTKDPIKFNFDSSYTCTYYLNNSEEVYNYLPGEVLYKDGSYIFTIKDNSGNVKTITFEKDSTCRFRITNASLELNVINGSVVNANSLIFNNYNDTSFVKLLKFNGEIMDVNDNLTFTKTGHYELIVEDAVNNTAYFSFYLVNHAVCEFNYTVPSSYIINEVYRTASDGRYPYLDAVSNDLKVLNLELEGTYDVVLKNIYLDTTLNFQITINKDLPTATLVGVENHGVTMNDITLKDIKTDDVVLVYKNNELVAKYEYANGDTFKTITLGGNYKIVVTNAQGVSSELTFVKKDIANTPLSILIIIICILCAGGFFIGLLLRNRSKFDE